MNFCPSPTHNIGKWILLEKGFGLCRGIGLHSFYQGILSRISIQTFYPEWLFWAAEWLPWAAEVLLWTAAWLLWTAEPHLLAKNGRSGLEKGSSGLLKWSWTVVRRPWTAKSSCGCSGPQIEQCGNQREAG